MLCQSENSRMEAIHSLLRSWAINERPQVSPIKTGESELDPRGLGPIRPLRPDADTSGKLR